jgi:hypothetical protein
MCGCLIYSPRAGASGVDEDQRRIGRRIINKAPAPTGSDFASFAPPSADCHAFDPQSLDDYTRKLRKAYLVSLFEDTDLAVIHAECVTIQPKNPALAQWLYSWIPSRVLFPCLRIICGVVFL